MKCYVNLGLFYYSKLFWLLQFGLKLQHQALLLFKWLLNIFQNVLVSIVFVSLLWQITFEKTQFLLCSWFLLVHFSTDCWLTFTKDKVILITVGTSVSSSGCKTNCTIKKVFLCYGMPQSCWRDPKCNRSMQCGFACFSTHMLQIPWKSLLKYPSELAASCNSEVAKIRISHTSGLQVTRSLAVLKKKTMSWLKCSNLQFSMWCCPCLIHLSCPPVLVSVDTARHFTDRLCWLCSFSNSELVSPCEECCLSHLWPMIPALFCLCPSGNLNNESGNTAVVHV